MNFFSPSFSWFSRIDHVLCCLVFVLVILKFVVVWAVASCHIRRRCQRFGGTFCFHLESCFYHEEILSSWRSYSQTFGSICKTILCRNPESHNFPRFRICGGRLTQSGFFLLREVFFVVHFACLVHDTSLMAMKWINGAIFSAGRCDFRCDYLVDN